MINNTDESSKPKPSPNGKWKFRWTKTPDERILNFYSPQYDCTDWKDIDVPANWEVNGYGTPIYIYLQGILLR